MAVVLNATAEYIVGLSDDYFPVKRNPSAGLRDKRKIELLSKLRRMSPENHIKIEEIIDTMLDE